MGTRKITNEMNRNFKRSGGGSLFIKNKTKLINEKNVKTKNTKSSNKTHESFLVKIDNHQAETKAKQSNSTECGFFVTSNENNDASSSSRNKNIKRKRDNKKIESKKPFDKKRWRLQRYSKKYKLDQWEDKRKKVVLRQYYREIKDEDNKFDVQKIYNEEEERSNNDAVTTKEENENENNLNVDVHMGQSSGSMKDVSKKNSKSIKGRAFKKAHLEFERIKQEKQRKREEMNKKKAERDEALKAYNEKKFKKFKVLSKKTKKGQPIMKGRMEMLLEQIQYNMTND